MPQSEFVYLGGRLMSTQICSMLIKELKCGIFSGVHRLPSEIELSERFGVSRTVIRDALSDLEREGFVDRVRGIGTVVNREIVNLSNRLDLKFEYNELIRNAGYEPFTDCVSLRIEDAQKELAQKLELKLGEPVIVCEKRILAGKKPVIYSIDYLAKHLFDDFNLSDIDWSAPIFDLLERYCGLVVVTNIAKVIATNATPSIRKMLEIEDCAALLMLDEIGYCKLSRPVLRSYEFYTDFFDFTMLRKKF